MIRNASGVVFRGTSAPTARQGMAPILLHPRDDEIVDVLVLEGSRAVLEVEQVFAPEPLAVAQRQNLALVALPGPPPVLEGDGIVTTNIARGGELEPRALGGLPHRGQTREVTSREDVLPDKVTCPAVLIVTLVRHGDSLQDRPPAGAQRLADGPEIRRQVLLPYSLDHLDGHHLVKQALDVVVVEIGRASYRERVSTSV